VLKDSTIRFQGRNFKVLAQPTFGDGQLYWKSIEDCLQFAKAAEDGRSVISGSFLYGLFNEANPEIMNGSDFENPNIPFEAILVTDGYGRYPFKSCFRSVGTILRLNVAFVKMCPETM
jgi:hypothetical protein